MSSLETQAGWLMIDHRASPGSPEVPEGKLFETKTYVCKHCNFVVIMNMKRTRAREVCIKCMAIICDVCAATGECRPFMSQYENKPNTIVSTPNIPYKSTSNLILPDYYTSASNKQEGA